MIADWSTNTERRVPVTPPPGSISTEIEKIGPDLFAAEYRTEDGDSTTPRFVAIIDAKAGAVIDQFTKPNQAQYSSVNKGRVVLIDTESISSAEPTPEILIRGLDRHRWTRFRTRDRIINEYLNTSAWVGGKLIALGDRNSTDLGVADLVAIDVDRRTVEPLKNVCTPGRPTTRQPRVQRIHVEAGTVVVQCTAPEGAPHSTEIVGLR